MLSLEKMSPRTITSANYITSVNGMLHPTRTMAEHDFLYILDGTWEVIEDGIPYELQTDDLLILCAGRHHTGVRLCNPGNRHMYFHVLPTKAEQRRNMEANCTQQKTSSGLMTGRRAGTLNRKKIEETEPDAEGKKEASGFEQKEKCIEQNKEKIQGNARKLCMDKMEAAEDTEDPRFLRSHTLIHCQKEPKIRQYFHELISAYWGNDAQREDRLTLLFNLILCELSSLQAETAGGPGSNSMLERVRQKIYSNPQVFFSAPEMAAEFYICPRTLNNRFRASCNQTFSAYQMDLKLEMVREFLSHQPDAKLHEAAVNFGFYDEFHLSKAFKKKYGYPPSKLRGSIDKKGTLD